MITTSERNRIKRLAFKAIKSFYGVQEKLTFDSYSMVESSINRDTPTYEHQIRYGWFECTSSSGKRYKFRLTDFNNIDYLERITNANP